MTIVALTGGVAAGKSTVTEVLSSLGAHIIDADVLAREAVEPDTPAFERSLHGSALLSSINQVVSTGQLWGRSSFVIPRLGKPSTRSSIRK
jgi:shikimate kinase